MYARSSVVRILGTQSFHERMNMAQMLAVLPLVGTLNMVSEMDLVNELQCINLEICSGTSGHKAVLQLLIFRDLFSAFLSVCTSCCCCQTIHLPL